MTTPLDQVRADELGERLRGARENAKITQEAAATSLKIARTTLVAIEKGERRIRIDELQQLAKLYGSSVNALLRQEAVFVDLVPQFRKLSASKEDAVANAAGLLADLVKAEVELENLLGIERVRRYPPERRIMPGDVRVQAEQDALELRQWLGLGLGPIPDMEALLEFELGVRLHVRKLDARISGLFAYDPKVGACMLLNANHPRERRASTGAHETGHLSSTRHEPEVLHAEPTSTSREERYADAFGRAFLMPARTVMERFRELTAGSPRLTRRHIIVLAHSFSVAREAMVKRLEELKLTKPDTWDWFQSNGGITNEQAKEVLGEAEVRDKRKADAASPVSLRLAMLADEVWRQELLSEGQLAALLRVDRVELRELFDRLTTAEKNSDDGPRLRD